MAYLGILKKDDQRRDNTPNYVGWDDSKFKRFIKNNKRKKNKLSLDLDVYKCKSGYREYLKTDWWKSRKKKFFENHLKICYCCGKGSKDLHHNNYSRLGQELDKDLVLLCHDCHTEVHEIQKQTGKLKDNHKELKKLKGFIMELQ